MRTGVEEGKRSNIRTAFACHIIDAHGGKVSFRRGTRAGRNIVTMELPIWKD